MILSRLQHFRAAYGMLLCILVSAGCASKIIPRRGSGKSDVPVAKLQLTYRTDTDRLNGVGSFADVPFVSRQQPMRKKSISGGSIGFLHIVYPHPNGRTDVGQAKLFISTAGTGSAVVSHSIWTTIQNRFSGEDPTDVDAAGSILEVWTMDIPQSQLEGIAAKLKKLGFFRKRVKVLSPDVYLAAQINNDLALGKNYPSVAVLDALILQLRGRGGHLVYARNSSSGRKLPGKRKRITPTLVRLPTVTTW